MIFLGPRFGKQLKTQPTFLEDKARAAECTNHPLLHQELSALQAGSAGHTSIGNELILHARQRSDIILQF